MVPSASIRRNDPCPCGSGQRYKLCHGRLGDVATPAAAPAEASAAPQPHDDDLQRAMLLHQQGDIAQAMIRYRHILASRPDHPVALHFLGVAQWQSGDPEAALPLLEQSLAHEAGIPDFHNNHALVLKALHRQDEAIAACQRALQLQPDNLNALNTLGLLLLDLQQAGAAAEPLQRAVTQEPHFVEARVNLANARYMLQDYDSALSHFAAALQLQPQLAAAHTGRANTLHKLDRLDEALAAADAALALDAHAADAHNTRAIILLAQGRTDEAVAAVRAALAAQPEHGAALITLGNIAARQGEYSQALTHYRHAELQAIQRGADKDLGEARNNLAIMQLALGSMESAWRAYAWKARRPREEADPDDPGLPLPLPAAGTGQSLVLLGEQGLGDILFFLRAAVRLAARGFAIEFCGDPRLEPLLSRHPAFTRCTTQPTPGARPIWLAELPYLAGGMPQELPPLELVSAASHRASLHERLASLGAGPHVAITWRAGTRGLAGHDRALFKAIALPDLAQALREVPGTLVSVQRRPEAGETEELARLVGRPVHDWSAVNEDLEQMLALMAVVDDYVGVSNTNMHLRASAGRTATVLVPHPPEWRWMATGDSSPWFPGFRIVRQQRDGTWPGLRQALIPDQTTGHHA